MKSWKFHYFYKITRFDGMYYLGIHSTNVLDDGYFGSGVRLRNSVRTHGKEKHSMQILEYFSTRDAALVRERQAVNSKTLLDPKCMNLVEGGQSQTRPLSAEGRQLISQKHIGKSVSEITRKKLSERIISQEWRNRMSTAAKNRQRVPLAEEHRKKISSANTGRKVADTSKMKEAATKRDHSKLKDFNLTKRKQCTIDGNTVFSSKKELALALGNGKNGTRHPNFRYVFTSS